MRLLVDEIADVGEDAVAQFHAQQARIGRGAEALFKALKHLGGKIRLLRSSCRSAALSVGNS